MKNILGVTLNETGKLFYLSSSVVCQSLQDSGNLENQKYENGIIAYILRIDSHNKVTVKEYGSYELISTWQAAQEKSRFINMIKSKWRV
jgi:hypothetical protein